MTITLKQAKALKVGDILHMPHYDNADGSPKRWRVNGKVKTWKRTPHAVRVPIKHGLYSHGYLTYHDLHLFCMTAEEAIAERNRKVI